ncbi:MAG TPA: ABC transporter permease [Methylomirabilota bacterium]|jgi:ABC-type nitrate/sulfonate/bicarbonate transport system permease component
MPTSETAAAPLNLDLGPPKKQVVSIWVKLRAVYPFLAALAGWEVAAWYAQRRHNLGQLFPTLEDIFIRAWELVAGPLMKALQEEPSLGLLDYFYYLGQSEILLHTLATGWRLLVAFAIGSSIGVAIGILMGRYSFWESFFVPLLAVLLPIPALVWVPIATIWFGLGNHAVIIVVSFAVFIPIAFGVWTGVKTVNPIWIRAAQSMNAPKIMIFRTVVLPGSLPMIMSSLRVGMARAWRAGVAAEFFSGIDTGLSAAIFLHGQQFLDIAFMMVALAVLGGFGYGLERVLFQPIERRTLVRWGMMEAMGAQGRRA